INTGFSRELEMGLEPTTYALRKIKNIFLILAALIFLDFSTFFWNYRFSVFLYFLLLFITLVVN
ncbi:MAG: hypothetical protein V8Q40_08445, partial [Anaerosacchariphilus sp.]